MEKRMTGMAAFGVARLTLLAVPEAQRVRPGPTCRRGRQDVRPCTNGSRVCVQRRSSIPTANK